MTSYSIPPIIAPLIANPPLYISLDTTLYAFWAFDIKNTQLYTLMHQSHKNKSRTQIQT